MGGKWRGLPAFVWTFWKLNLAGAMEFRMSFLLTAGMMLVNNVVWVFFWGVYFQRFSVVNGWAFQDVMMMWAISAGGFGFMAVFFGNANRLAQLISTGQLDVYLAQPKPVLLHVLVSRMSVSAIGDIVFGFLLFAIFGEKTWLGALKFGLALLIATLIFLFFIVIVNAFAFYMGNAEGLAHQMFQCMLAFATYPTDIFRSWGRLLLFTVVPAGFISYLPIGLLRSVELPFLLGALGVTALLSVGGTWFFYRGLRRYTSGNMMTMRS
ncbi:MULTISPECIES: ABC transporter permease [unclassified Paenibacillus]|uniref:ABC transporter permease n=1 Tax=unclassified Paenibacillus TaxID=185978 RepID=UPI0009303D22|nr:MULTISPECIES: ABC-2 family transporter protein [unclassified Paenibacillus]